MIRDELGDGGLLAADDALELGLPQDLSKMTGSTLTIYARDGVDLANELVRALLVGFHVAVSDDRLLSSRRHVRSNIGDLFHAWAGQRDLETGIFVGTLLIEDHGHAERGDILEVNEGYTLVGDREVKVRVAWRVLQKQNEWVRHVDFFLL